MTSANVTQYRIFDSNDNEVGTHYQSHLCKTKWHELLRFSPPENFTIQPWGYDEDDELWEGEVINLRDFLKRVIK